MGSIDDVVRERALASPDSSVLLARSGPPLTSAALEDLVVQTRNHLNAHGIGRGDRVALVIADSARAQAAYVAFVCSTVAVPLNPKLTPFELEHLFRTIRVKAVVTSEDTPEVISLARRMSLDLFLVSGEPERGVGFFSISGGAPGPANLPGASMADDLATVLTSSGTTGRPKAVPEKHSLILGRLEVDVEILGLSASDVTINFRPPYLAGPLNIGLMASVYTGGAIVVPPAFDGRAFCEDLTRFGITWYTGGPAYHRAILEAAPEFREAIAQSKLRFARSAGYALPVDLQAEIEATMGVPCVQKYGSSEAGLISCNPLPPGKRKPGTSGTIRDCEVRIVSHDGNDLPTGETGEILVRGPKVIPGYDDPEMTRTAFRDGWYCTGDLGSIDEDGYLTISGRANEVINRGGQKISPVEVEDAFEAIPGVAAALCFPVPHETLGSTAAIAVTADESTALDPGALRRAASERLSRFKVPETILVRDQLPIGPTGKPLRLRAASFFGISGTGDDSGLELRPPTDKLEEIWCSVLKSETLHDDLNFTRAGGDSIRAVRLQIEIEKAYGVALPADVMYGEGATPAGLRALVAAIGPGERRETPASLPKRADLAADLPLTSNQQRLWSQSKLYPGHALYNCSFALRFSEPFDLGLIERIAQRLAARHEVLRAYFPVIDGRPVQRFSAEWAESVSVYDLRDLPTNQRERHLQQSALESMRRPFDLDAGPLFRVSVVRLGDNDTVVQVETHHTINDAVTSSMLSREFTTCFEAYSSGRIPDLQEVTRDFGDLVKHQTDHLSSEHGAALIEEWVARLADVPALVEIPRDHPRPKSATRDGARAYFKFSTGLGEKVRKAAAACGTSPYLFLFAAFELLVTRMTGRSQFIIGTAVNTRPPEFHDLIAGFAINTLPVRVDIEAKATFRDQVQQAQSRVRQARDESAVPFQELVQRLADPGDRSAPPLVQIMFGYLPRGTRPEDTKFAQRNLWNLDGGGARFDFTVMVDETVAGLGGFVEYATELYEEPTVQRIIDRFRFLVETLVEDPSLPLEDYAVTPPEELALIESYSNGPERAYPENTTIHAAFQDVARARPESVAIIHGDARVTYRELDEASDAVAQKLVESRIAPADVVGVTSERNPDTLIAILGILKAGAAYLPLDPALPAERLAAMIEDAGTELVLVQTGTEIPDTIPVKTRTLASDPLLRTGAFTGPETSSRDLAYVMFTSGSTGRPKGVEVEHRSVLQTVLNQSYVEIRPGDRLASTGTFGFDASVFEIFGALLNGGTLVLPQTQMPSINDYADMLICHRVDIAWFTAGLFREMIDWRIDCFEKVSWLLVGGDVVPPDRVKKLSDAYPKCRIVNGYGPTENTVFSICGELSPDALACGETPLGRPIANSTTWILDDCGRPVPLGVEGDLFLGGDGLARGYRNRPDLTNAAFTDDPVRGRLYRSGDRARFLADGQIDFLGRKDSQLKIRGFRVELEEIEVTLREHDDIVDAVAIAHRDGSTVREIGVVVIPRQMHVKPQISALRAHLSSALPSYMVPNRFAFVDRFPLNASGKIDRSALLDLSEATHAAQDQTEIVMPRTPVEELLHDIWSRVLGVDTFGIDQSFFELGGSSLQMMQLGFLVSEETGLDLAHIEFFDNPTIRSMALHVFQKLVEDDEDVRQPAQ